MTTAVVIAHYNENLDWLKKVLPKHKIFVYSKTDNNHSFITPNKGNEATCYLKYIIDNYNNLYDKNLFLHGHEHSYHQDNTADYIINNLNWNLANYFSVTKRDWYFTQGINETFHRDTYNVLKTYWAQIFKDALPLPKSLHHYSCAQFQVNKFLIQQIPITFYEHLYEWLMSTNLENYQSSRIFEHTWHYIFTKKSIEPIHKSIF
jgi:hypothetical protein